MVTGQFGYTPGLKNRKAVGARENGVQARLFGFSRAREGKREVTANGRIRISS